MFPDCDIWELARTLARWIATHMALEINIRFGAQRPGSSKAYTLFNWNRNGM